MRTATQLAAFGLAILTTGVSLATEVAQATNTAHARHRTLCGALAIKAEFTVVNRMRSETNIVVNARQYTISPEARTTIHVPYAAVSAYIPNVERPRYWVAWDDSFPVPRMVCTIKPQQHVQMLNDGQQFDAVPTYGLLVVENRGEARPYSVNRFPCSLQEGRNEFWVRLREVTTRVEGKTSSSSNHWTWKPHSGRWELNLTVD